jgi:phage FluMu protein Com
MGGKMIRKYSILDRDQSKREAKDKYCIDCGNLLSQVECKANIQLIDDSKRCPNCREINYRKVLEIQGDYFPSLTLSNSSANPESLQGGSGRGVLGEIK